MVDQTIILEQIKTLQKRIVRLTAVLKKIIIETMWGWRMPYQGELNARSELIDKLVNEIYSLTPQITNYEIKGKVITATEKIREERIWLVNLYEEWRKTAWFRNETLPR